MVKLDKIYTRGGDEGSTSLGDGSRVKKNNLRVVDVNFNEINGGSIEITCAKKDSQHKINEQKI